MTLAPWRPVLARALHRNRARAYCRYLQLATLTPQGRPSNRTLVFRGFVNDALQMVTDSRSEKLQHIKICPWAEICWYFTVTREQFRITGELTVIDTHHTGDIRQTAWQSQSNKARQQFYWPHPGQARASDALFESDDAVTDSPPDSFNVLLLYPERVDHLNLRGDPQNRYIYQRDDDGWKMQEVNP
ncbi:MAG: Npun_F5749 family FMN-dependent PPOX-type flavoprotein [Leptolyngbyaceae cyanobacterium]